MGYIEHNCGIYHYGDMSVVRPCCVEEAKKYKELTLKNALTREHPAYKAFVSAWNDLTTAEMHIVGDIYQIGYAEGFAKSPPYQYSFLDISTDDGWV